MLSLSLWPLPRGSSTPPPALPTLHELLTEQMELMELAMLKVNRPLYPKDFKAITEALHRHFRANGGIPERGYNTVHSHATRRRAYSSLVQRVLPDIGFPDYVRFKQG